MNLNNLTDIIKACKDADPKTMEASIVFHLNGTEYTNTNLFTSFEDITLDEETNTLVITLGKEQYEYF